jgi:hypothetical protein
LVSDVEEGRSLRLQVIRDRWFVAIIFAALLYSVGPFLVQSLTAAKYKTSAGEATVPFTALAARMNSLSSLLLMAVCIAAIVRSAATIPRTGRVRLMVLLAPWVYIVVNDAYQGAFPHRTEFIYPLIVVAVFCLRPRLISLQALGYSAGAVAAIALFMGWFVPAKGIFQLANGTEISADKEIFSSGILNGPFPQGNNLGVFLVMGMATVFAIRRRFLLVVLLALTVYAQLWAASRSCLAAAAIVIILAAVLRVATPRAKAYLVGVVLFAELAFLTAVPLLTTDVTAFTNRGYVWQVSKQAWHVDEWFGRGSNYYGRVAATSANLGGSVFHGHNQLIQALVTGGVLYALLLGAVVVLAISTAVRLARQGAHVGAYWVAAFIGACTLEVSFAVVDRYYDLAVMLVPLACVVFTSDLGAVRPPAGAASDSPPQSAQPNGRVGFDVDTLPPAPPKLVSVTSSAAVSVPEPGSAALRRPLQAGRPKNYPVSKPAVKVAGWRRSRG